MKKLNFGKVIAAIKTLFASKNLEWNLAQSYKSFDTNNIYLRRDMSVFHK